MNSNPIEHNQDHQDNLFLYALQAFCSSEIHEVEAQIAACTSCQHEIEAMRRVTESFVSWPADVLRPSASLWNRLAERIGGETDQLPILRPSPPAPNCQWEEAAPGISVKILSTDNDRQQVTMLVRLAPGTDYPPHRHAGFEELHLLDGELMIDKKKLYPGDHIRAQAGTVDHRVWSETGCTCLLITSTEDEILYSS
jgi:quercetin dioxygenase-like cupin family protein